MAERDIIKINEDLCDGCGKCVPSCAEGALKIIDGKVKLVSEVYCDGLGACIGNCPNGALEVISRDAEEFDKEKVEQHLSDGKPREGEGLGDGAPVSCPGTVNVFEKKAAVQTRETEAQAVLDEEEATGSQLSNWPIQINLVPPKAPYFENADLLISGDCVPFSLPGFHEKVLKGKVLLVGCPKLDDHDFYLEKLSQLFIQNNIKSVTVAYMEVPCCFGIVHLVREAIKNSGKEISLKMIRLSIKGKVLMENVEIIGGNSNG